MVSGMTGRDDGFKGVVFTSCTALGPLILRFSNSSSDAKPKQENNQSTVKQFLNLIINEHSKVRMT